MPAVRGPKARLRPRAAPAALAQDRLAPAPRARRRVRRCCRSRRSSPRSGARSQRDLGVQTIPLDSIVGTVDRRRGEFDRGFRPASPGSADAGRRIAAARRRGETMPPIDVYRIGDLHFVAGRPPPRVGRPRARRRRTIEAHVREVRTKLGAGESCGCATCRSSATSACSTSASRCRRERARADPALRRVALRPARDARRVVGLPRQPPPRPAPVTPGDGRAAWFREEYEPVVEVSATPTSAARAPRPSATCASPCCATCCSTPTTGPTT